MWKKLTWWKTSIEIGNISIPDLIYKLKKTGYSHYLGNMQRVANDLENTQKRIVINQSGSIEYVGKKLVFHEKFIFFNGRKLLLVW